jgi:hypothetical protein
MFHMKHDLVLSRGAVAPAVAATLYAQLRQAAIPPDLAVPFLVRVRGWRIADFCAELGIHRSYFSALLKGQHSVSLTLRYGVRSRLGFDPWRATTTPAAGEVLDLSTHPGELDRPQHEGAVR